MTAHDTNTLADLLSAKCEVLQQVRALGARQLELIQLGELGQLLNLLALKQRLLSGLQSLERKLDPFRQQRSDERIWSNDDDRRRCADLAQQSERLLAEIIDSERGSEAQLTLRRDEASTRLQAVHFAAQARDAYLQPATESISQVDLSSS